MSKHSLCRAQLKVNEKRRSNKTRALQHLLHNSNNKWVNSEKAPDEFRNELRSVCSVRPSYSAHQNKAVPEAAVQTVKQSAIVGFIRCFTKENAGGEQAHVRGAQLQIAACRRQKKRHAEDLHGVAGVGPAAHGQQEPVEQTKTWEQNQSKQGTRAERR